MNYWKIQNIESSNLNSTKLNDDELGIICFDTNSQHKIKPIESITSKRYLGSLDKSKIMEKCISFKINGM